MAEDFLKSCKSTFCNPKCKGTVFQNGEFPQEIVNKCRKEKWDEDRIKNLKKMRQELFKGKKTVLKGDFYEDLKGYRKYKKKGAISGCTKILL